MLEREGRLPDARDRLRRRRLERDRHVRRLPRRRRGRARRRRGRRRGSHGRHAAPLTAGRAVSCTARARCSQDEDGQIAEAHSISAGLDYPGVGPSTRTCATPAGRATSARPTTRRSRRFRRLARTEGIIPALEPAHALAWVDEPDARADRRLPLGPRRQGPRRGSRPSVSRLVLANLLPLSVDEARQIDAEERECGEELDHRRAPHAARAGSDPLRRRGERRRDCVVEEVGNPWSLVEAAERLVRIGGPEAGVEQRPECEEREAEQRQADVPNPDEDRRRSAAPSFRATAGRPQRRRRPNSAPSTSGATAPMPKSHQARSTVNRTGIISTATIAAIRTSMSHRPGCEPVWPLGHSIQPGRHRR